MFKVTFQTKTIKVEQRKSFTSDQVETFSSREVVDIYSDPSCVLRQAAPDNYCEVTVLQSLHTNRRRVSSLFITNSRIWGEIEFNFLPNLKAFKNYFRIFSVKGTPHSPHPPHHSYPLNR